MPFIRRANLTLQFGAYFNNLSERYKIDFELTLATGGTFSGGSISVTGLSSFDIATMATFYSYEGGGQAILLPNTITLLAGYLPTLMDPIPRYGMIFMGSAFQATTALSESDKSISFEVSSAYYSNVVGATSLSYPTTTLSIVCTQIALQMGKIINFNPVCERTIKNYEFTGTADAHIESLRTTYPDLYFYLDNTTFTVTDSKVPALDVPVVVTPFDIIGTPEPTFIGCNVTTLLNPLSKPGASLILTSKRLPQLSGAYIINSVKHVGSTRDSQFYTTYECKRATL